MRSIGAAALLVLGCAGSAPAVAPAPARPAGAADVAYHLLEGRFDSSDQARSSPGYAAFQIVACPADVPSLGPRVLYVEQTRVGGDRDEPFRQRVYVVEPGEPLESAAVLRVFELTVPGSSVGACGASVPPRFTRDEVMERLGCAVPLRVDGTVFRGATSGRSCPASQKGATYAMNELVLDSVGFRSWERGFDAAGTKRWGTDTGPYVFVRRTPLPMPMASDSRPVTSGSARADR